MKFGNLNSIFENDETIYEAINNNILNESAKDNVIQNKMNKGNEIKQSRWSKILIGMSNYGMNWQKNVLKNMQAVPADKQLQPKDDVILQQTLVSNFMNNWKAKGEEEKSFSEKTLEQKRDILRKMAMQPELEDILDIMTNECIVYDDDNSYIAYPFLDTSIIQDLNEKSADEIRNGVDTSFYKLYLLLDWKRSAWDDFRRYLVDGVLAYEIIYDNIEYPKSIVGIIDIDPATLTKVIKDGITYWVQFKDIVGKERWLLDAQVIYIKYEDSGVVNRQSYLERLIRPFNIYRIVEQAQVIWTVTQSSFKTLFTIPINGMNRSRGEQTLNAAMNKYREDISFNTETGELKVNDKVNLPFNKEYFMPQNESGKPEIETLVDQGPQLNDSDQLKYFERKLYKISKIPENRFDSENQSTWFGTDATQAMRDEITFGRFVARLRNNFSEIMLKPLRIQLSLLIPDIKNDKRILDSISLKFNSYNQFEELMNIELMTKRIEFIGTFKDSLTIQDGEDEVPFFDPEFLIVKYLKMSEADLKLNEKYKMKNKLKNSKDEEEDEEEESDVSGDDLLGGDDNESEDKGSDNDSESDESSDVDDEMLGDVQPESTESTQL